MKGHYLIEKSSIKGNSIAVIIIFSGCIILFLSVFAAIFDKALSKVMIQEVTDTIDNAGYEFYHHVDFNKLSYKDIEVKKSIVSDINKMIIVKNPQIKEFQIVDATITKDILEMKAYIIFQPTLYRELFNLHSPYYFTYELKIPADFGGE